MLLSTYSQARRHFAAPGAPTAPDGWPAWPGPVLGNGTGAIDNTAAASKLRINGFSGTLVARTSGGLTFQATTIGPLVDLTKIPDGDSCWPLSITCNSFAADAVTGVHDFDFFVSLRRGIGRHPVAGSRLLSEFPASSLAFAVAMPDATKSGTITLTPNVLAVGLLFPTATADDLLSDDAFTTLFRHVHVYAHRRSDGAYQWARLYRD